jgi:hypothetical protein
MVLHSEEFYSLLGSLKIFSVHKNPLLIFIRSHINPIHTLLLNVLKTILNIIFPSTPTGLLLDALP